MDMALQQGVVATFPLVLVLTMKSSRFAERTVSISSGKSNSMRSMALFLSTCIFILTRTFVQLKEPKAQATTREIEVVLVK